MTINGSGSVVEEDRRLLELTVMRYIVFESRRSEKKGQVVDKEQLSWRQGEGLMGKTLIQGYIHDGIINIHK